MESRGCVSLRLFLSFSKRINLDLPFHLDPCSTARGSLQHQNMPPTWCDPTTGAAFVDAARLARSSRSHRLKDMPLLGNLTSVRRVPCPSVLCLNLRILGGFRGRHLVHVTSSSDSAESGPASPS